MSQFSFFYNLKIGHRIYALVAILLLFIGIIGGTGVYKMTIIGHEMEEIATRDLPLAKLLEKITVHQLEQGILLEKGLRYKGVSAHSEGETFESIVEHFKEIAKKTDKEILEAEEMIEEALAGHLSEYAHAEFLHVLEELKKIEKEHKDYEHHVEEIFAELARFSDMTSSMNAKVVQAEEEQNALNIVIEELLLSLP
jgi:methyl-accepting chemotaxis protein